MEAKLHFRAVSEGCLVWEKLLGPWSRLASCHVSWWLRAFYSPLGRMRLHYGPLENSLELMTEWYHSCHSCRKIPALKISTHILLSLLPRRFWNSSMGLYFITLHRHWTHLGLFQDNNCIIFPQGRPLSLGGLSLEESRLGAHPLEPCQQGNGCPLCTSLPSSLFWASLGRVLGITERESNTLAK